MTASARRGPFGRDSSNLCLHRGLDGCRYRTCIVQGGAIDLNAFSNATIMNSTFESNSAQTVSLSLSLFNPSILLSWPLLCLSFISRRCDVCIGKTRALSSRANHSSNLHLHRWLDGLRLHLCIAQPQYAGGGAILLWTSSSAKITRSVFKNNSATADVSLFPSLSDPSLL